MPGLVVFRRRWSVGSDDLVVPGAFLLTLHFICFVIVLISLIVFEYNITVLSVKLLFYHLLGYSIVLFLSICVEIGICIVSMRGSILDSEIRATINIWIYLKSLVILFDFAWLILGVVWLSKFYVDAPIDQAKKVFLAIIICNWVLLFVTITTIWCVFDAAGRSWVKMKQYQRSMRETESRFNYKRSGSMNRNWRQRKVIRAYQDSWDHRCRLLFCCIGSSERNRNSFTDIARLLSDFFRELDVVPSDVVAGLVLLRKFQKVEREAVVRQRKNGTYEFLSGVPITEHTEFLALNDAKSYDFFQSVIHYMYFAQGAYGWPMYFILNRSNMWHLIPELRCFGCCSHRNDSCEEVIEDNCCLCNYAALKKTLQVGDIEIIYVTYHVDVGETPFFVAIDYTQKKIVVSIRGTLSMKDILTDLNAEGEVLPLKPTRDDWLGHKGMTQAAIYIKRKLEEEHLIERALNHNTDRNTHTFDLVLVGHSLGAGTAAILAILMKPDYPTLRCFSYSPPGGLLSMPAAEYSKSFITSVVLGKDVVPRIGLNQMEALRADLINAIQRSVDPKWKTISCSVICCGCGPEPTSVVEMSGKDTHINEYQEQRDTARSTSVHPADSSIALTLHQPLYPPGRIIHIVRHHPKPDENVLKTREPVYQAIWAETVDFSEVLISPVMLQDHMPDQVLAALKKERNLGNKMLSKYNSKEVVTTSGPRKPQRQSNAFSTVSNDLSLSDCEHEQLVTPIDYRSSTVNYRNEINHNANRNSINSYSNLSNCGMLTPIAQHKVCLETSFTNLQSPLELNSALFNNSICGGPNSSKTSSIAGSILGRSLQGSLSTSTAAQYDNASSVIDGSSITTVTRRSPSVPSEATTVIIHEQTGDVVPLQRIKAVAFDINISSTNVIAKSPSPQVQLKSILQRQNSTRMEKKKSPKHLTLLPLRRSSDVSMNDNKKLDLVHDDWLGLAPLASPETLSEISSISSRTTSAAISLASSIERYLQNLSLDEANTVSLQQNGGNGISTLNDIYESQLHTPKVMRRAPKFTENLANCAEDNKNLEQYKRMGRVFVTFPRIFPLPDEQHLSGGLDDSSDESYESAHSRHKAQQIQVASGFYQKQSSKSADQLDEDASLEAKESATKKLTFSDSQILSDDYEQDTNVPCNVSTTPGSENTGSVETTFFSANSSIEQFSTPGKNINGVHGTTTDAGILLRPGVLESHFPVFKTNQNQFEPPERDALLSNNPSSPIANITPTAIVGGRIRKRLSSEEFIFTRNEELPTIVQFGDRISNSTPSPSGRKRKVFPAATTATRFLGETSISLSYTNSNSSPSKNLQTNKNESSV